MTQKLEKLTAHDHDKYLTTPEFNKLTTEKFAARLAQANLITKKDFDNTLISLNRKFNSNQTKHSLVENELKKNKHLIKFILEAKVISNRMAHKII